MQGSGHDSQWHLGSVGMSRSRCLPLGHPLQFSREFKILESDLVLHAFEGGGVGDPVQLGRDDFHPRGLICV